MNHLASDPLSLPLHPRWHKLSCVTSHLRALRATLAHDVNNAIDVPFTYRRHGSGGAVYACVTMSSALYSAGTAVQYLH